MSERQTENAQVAQCNAQNRSKCGFLNQKGQDIGCKLYAMNVIFYLRGEYEQLNVSSLIKETLRKLNYSGQVKIKKDFPDRLKKMDMEKNNARTQRHLIEAYSLAIVSPRNLNSSNL